MKYAVEICSGAMIYIPRLVQYSKFDKGDTQMATFIFLKIMKVG
jgi:hypothetical protein